MGHSSSSKALLDLEARNSSSSSAIESTLTVCNTNKLSHSQTPKSRPPDGVPSISSVPKSQVLGKVKDFLGVLSESNKRLQLDAKDNCTDYDIEVLTGNESEYIEMDLMLGVAELQTPEAVAAAESAIAGYQPVIPVANSSSGTESDDTSDDDDDSDDDENATCSPNKLERSKLAGKHLPTATLTDRQPKKRPKIVELP